MKKLWEMWNSWNLILRILGGMAVGIVLALLFHTQVLFGGTALIPLSADVLQGVDEFITIFGTLFVSALKAIAPILVFFLVIGALANAQGVKGMKNIVLLYIASTVIAGLLAVIASFAFPSTLIFQGAEDVSNAPQGIGEVLTNLLVNAVTNPVGALANANYLGILVWGCLLGIAMRHARQSTKDMFQDAADAVSTVVRWIIAFAPFGIMGLIYSALITSGAEIFTVYGHLVLVLVAVILVAALVTNPLLVAITTRTNPFPLVLRTLKDSALTAFFTRSSAANIPVNMKLCEDLGLNRDTYSVSIPLGATINMAGACITISIMTMAAANTLGIQVDFLSAVILCVLAAVSACGASGVAGGSLLLIPLACSLFGIPADISAQVIGVGFIIGVIQDSCETALNSSSDVVFTATAELIERRKAGLSTKLPLPKTEEVTTFHKDETAEETTDELNKKMFV